ncbi:mitochondrial thiamine pyrophosphate transporter [Physocladia obscura]|uniref:Mitochondrial thiamine pyrophosphate transporter n=1 Tax=Physocladia obscura TaxID=109957 RepID=A0AAD5SZU6_9FUNG|nr:mitochondrial thiamine pyrophosphate transporter [Physocladia obscura]
MGIMFSVQDILVERLKRVEHGYWPHVCDQFASGATAGIISKTAVMPFDIVRKQLEVQGPSRNLYVISNIPQYNGFGFAKCAREIVRTEGIFALYKGLLPSLMKTAPSSAVTFWVVNECRHIFSEYNERIEESSIDRAPINVPFYPVYDFGTTFSRR